MTRTEAKKCPAMGHALSSKSSIGPKDIYTLEALSHFNREKIPERAVHALGSGAYGEFEVTHDISDICNIDMLLGVGKKTPLVTRFSTTGLERGSSDGVQDLKGMATKFFTKDGEWDWVFLNFPFFFIRDPAKFPDMIHSQRRDPQTNRLNPNMFWDFVTDNHESIHMTLLQYSDFGRMFTWRTLSSYAGHAFKWTMPDGSFKYVHFFLASDRGPNFTEGAGATMDPSDPDFGSKDLFEAIERGGGSERRAPFRIQYFGRHQALEPGHVSPGPGKIPCRPFGKLTLNRNVTDYFTEVEQLAFSPSHMVPGVEASEDPILQARMFAYPDAQRYRLGAIPRAPPSRMPSALKSEAELGQEFAEWVAQVSSDEWSGSHEDDYKFAREYYEVLPDFRSQDFQDRMVDRIVASVSQTREEIRDKVYRTFALVSSELARRVRDGVEKFDDSSKVQVTQSRL
ncbi:CAZyme family AA7 [Penicillium canescens]|uniref:CAZyme family AA7 n=1 Tax=Penicillium canescens TaxID=5083 RepID=UPI0026E059CE|nr:CAZyme family AA7 [Penicillium canescens]KAJ6061278.1 CAZyme family AA7 [Penicillium canescens]